MTSQDRGPLVVGILGGIASGKSAVARGLAGEHGFVLDADRFAREALESPELARKLLEHFGPEVLDAEGRPDRQALAERVFASPEDRALLEGWIHPIVRERIRAGLTEAREQGSRIVVLDVPLLLENDRDHGLAGLCAVRVFVEVADDVRDRRAVERRGWAPGEVARREAAQMPLAEKKAHADYVIQNQGSLAELERDVAELRRRLLAE